MQNAPQQPTPVAIYVRMSTDKEGAGLGVERQERECRELIDGLPGHYVSEVFTDNDVSATSGKPRPGYLALLESIRSGAVHTVVAWHTDRLHRSPLELEGYIDLGADTLTVKSGKLDLTTPHGRMIARLFGAVARHEVELKSERQKSKNRQTALKGEPPSGGPIPWGYLPDRLNLDPVTSEVFRDVHRRIMSGESLGSVLRWLNDKGVSTPRGGKRWAYSTLRGVLVRPLNAGLVMHEGTILAGVEGQWEPLVSPEEHHAMTALLADPSRRTTTGNKRKHLLAGIARCGNCLGTLKSGSVGNKNGKSKVSHLYRCQNPECTRKVNVSRDQLDRYVIDRLLSERGHAWVARVKPAENLGARLVDVQARIDGVAALLSQDGADFAVLVPRMQELTAERQELRKPRRVGYRLTDVAGDWERAAGDLNERRGILLGHLDSLLIASRGKTSHRFDPERVSLSWQPDAYDEEEDRLDSEARYEAYDDQQRQNRAS